MNQTSKEMFDEFMMDDVGAFDPSKYKGVSKRAPHEDAYQKAMDIAIGVFTKNDTGKLRYGLIPPIAEMEMVKVLTFGAQKYSPDNWKNVDDLSRYVDAALRHISAYRIGEQNDQETGHHHLAHAMCCLSFIVDLECVIVVKE